MHKTQDITQDFTIDVSMADSFLHTMDQMDLVKLTQIVYFLANQLVDQQDSLFSQLQLALETNNNKRNLRREDPQRAHSNTRLATAAAHHYQNAHHMQFQLLLL